MNRARRNLFRLLAVVAPILLLGLLELALRATGAGGYPPLFRKAAQTPDGTLYTGTRERPASFFGAVSGRISPMEPCAFFLPKGTGTVRIVVLGESAARGYPQPRAFAASEFLRRLLEAAWPDRQVEVINLACTAVASFPIRDIAQQALLAEPDAAIVYLGNNEFYGAYGVAANRRWGATPRGLELQRAVRRLALVQAPMRWMARRAGLNSGQTLIEIMAGQSYIAADDPLRDRATATLNKHLGDILRLYRENGIPLIVSTSPSNERDLAPIGEDPAHPQQALMRWRLGRSALAAGEHEAARKHLLAARDFDPMPWRATTVLNETIRAAARKEGAVLCDLVEVFQRNSPHGLIGWELMDDHVHPTLAGQLLIARSWVDAMTNLPNPVRVGVEQIQRLPTDQQLLADAGDNPYERFGVAHTMRLLFDVPFFRRSNPEAAVHFQRIGQPLLDAMPPYAHPVVQEWQQIPMLSIGRRPLSGMMAVACLQQKKPSEALPLLRAARESVPKYTTWDIEYCYFDIMTRQQVQGSLTERDEAEARAAIERARILQQFGHVGTGQAERFAGRLHQVLGEYEAAIPWLESAGRKLKDLDRVACDQALLSGYVHLKRLDEARKRVQERIASNDRHRAIYEGFLRELDSGK